MIDAKKLELMQKLHSDDSFICFEQSKDTPGLIVEYEFTFEEMKTWILACARETPSPMVKVLNETTGKYL